MMLSVLLLLLLQSSVSLQNTDEDSQQTKVSLMNSPLEEAPGNRSVLTHQRLPVRSKQKRQIRITHSTYDNGKLKWVPFCGSLPAGAVSIYNTYAGRTDYICKLGCHSGFYNPIEGCYCQVATGYNDSCLGIFEVLVNENNFEILEWKDASSGLMPENSVRTCPEAEIYVGKNKYGLGKVDPKTSYFHLSWERSEYEYSYYEVLTMNRDVSRNQVTDVHYSTNKAVVIKQPPETMRVSVIKNAACSPVVKTVTLTKEIRQERRWDISDSVLIGVTTTMSAGLPGAASGSIAISSDSTVTSSGGLTMSEGITHSVSVQLTAPPNNICKAKMMGYKYTADIPFTARLQRTYTDGDTRTTTISGMYNGVQMGEAWAEVERCQPIHDAKPCL